MARTESSPMVPVLDFPPCRNDKQAWLTEAFILCVLPDLKAFCRELTPYEQSPEAAAEVGSANGAFIERLPGGDHRRIYGKVLPLGNGGARNV